MQKIITPLLFFFVVLLSNEASSQPSGAGLHENSVVKDTTGMQLPYAIWNQLLITGRYKIKQEKPGDPNTAFIIARMSEEEYERKLANMPKPADSKYFKTGARFTHFRTTDINGNKINTKALSGKILVINFWFINCPPCRNEIPGLNRLSEQYKGDSSVVFLAIALDQKYELKEFLKTHPFGYTVIDDGRSVSSQYGINGYPTNVVVSPEGNVAFHATGYALNTVPWIKKTVEKLKESTQKKE